MLEIKAPGRIPLDSYPILFLAGSIEMGAAEKWQDRVVRTLTHRIGTILNPRRDDWDNTWKQTLDDKNFVQQVEWEQQGMRLAHRVFFYFSPDTKSPITLMELGLCVGRRIGMPYSAKVVVCCPERFWRKGNVEILCRNHGIPMFHNFDTAVEYLKWC